MLSVKQIKDMCKGYTLPNLVSRKDTRLLFSDDDPAFWSNGFIALFAPLPAKYHDKETVSIAPKTVREMFEKSIKAATLTATPEKGGLLDGVKKSAFLKFVLMLRTNDDQDAYSGQEMWVNARYVRMAYVGAKAKDVFTFHVQPNGMNRPLVVKKNGKPHMVIMPIVRAKNKPWPPVLESEAIAEIEELAREETTPDANPDPAQEEPKAEKKKGVKKPKSKSPERGSKTNTTTPASVIPFSITFTLDGEVDLALPDWDLTDDHLTSPKLVGLDGLGDLFCMIDTLLEAKAKVTGLAIHVHGDLSKEDKANVKRLFVRYKPAFIGKNVALVPDENGGITFLGLKSVAYDMLICTHVYMCVSLVSRYLSELKGQDCTSTLPETKEDAAEAFILDHYSDDNKTYRICPSETIFEIRDLIWGFAKDGEILKI